jgi:hypothetical protein
MSRFFCGGIGSGYVIAVIRSAAMSRRIEGWERWLAPDYCFYLIFLVYFLQPVLHEGRFHAVEGYPS